MTILPASALDASLTYDEYRRLIDALLADGKTTGTNHSRAMLEYTRMSVVRMKRLDKTIRLLPELASDLKQLTKPMIWLVLTEAWCGDAGQSVPVMHALAAQNPHVDFRLLLRNEHPDIMDAFLTRGSRSIPKLIFLDGASREVLGSWGPRPQVLQQWIDQSRAHLAGLKDEQARKAYAKQMLTETQRWYARDKTASLQREIGEALRRALSSEKAQEEAWVRAASSNR